MRHAVTTLVTLGALLVQGPSVWAAAPAAVVGEHGMVVSAQRLASEVGADTLAHGGNAVDAAVAVGYALAVVLPWAGNLGGGGFMTIRFADGRATFLDFREHAPLAATATMYLDADGKVDASRKEKGYLSVATPGTVLGLDAALRRYGTMPRAALIAPAIKLAADGFTLTAGDVALLTPHTPDLAHDAAAAAIFLKDGKDVMQAGDRLVQTDLARSLRLIADGGPDAFYKGPIAQAIVAASQRHQGILAAADFERYAVRELKPVTCSYRGYQITAAPPPSSGGVTLCEMLNILEGYPLGAWGLHSAQTVHAMVEAMRYAYADRNSRLGDPDFVVNPVKFLTSKATAAQIRAKIDLGKAGRSDAVTPVALPQEGAETTHFSVMDQAGNAVAVTYTLNGWFGAGVVAEGTGIVLNDEMDDFSGKSGVANSVGLVTGDNNAIAPGKAPLSSMTPTIVSKGGKTVLVIGSVGGPTIITQVLGAIVNLIDGHASLADAVDAPRIHHQWLPDVVWIEPGALSPETERRLVKQGYKIQTRDRTTGMMEAILVGGPSLVTPARKPTQRYFGVNDRRAPAGAAVGE